MKTSTKWQYSGDVNMLDYGGKNIRCIGNRKFQVVELLNMDEACGRDNKGQSKYVVELRLVDLNSIGAENIKSAMECCGAKAEIDTDGNDVLPEDTILAELCDSYGTHAPMGSWNGNNAHNLLRKAYREAGDLLDSAKLESRLERPVNKLGSTAREFMNGDFTSAMQRGCEAGDPAARLTAKIYGVSQDTINDVRPDDFIPFVFGYMAGLNGQPKETDPDTAAEYFRGFERGVNVKAGKCPAPSWIKPAC